VSSAVSPQWEIMMLGGSAVALATVIICIRLWTNWARVRRARVGAAEPNTVEAPGLPALSSCRVLRRWIGAPVPAASEQEHRLRPAPPWYQPRFLIHLERN
jgi:hypothetical protein